MDEEIEAEIEEEDHDENNTQLLKLRAWATALRVMAWLWWLLGLVALILRIHAFHEIHRWEWRVRPASAVAMEVICILFFTALGGMLLYTASHVMVSVGEIEDNTLILVEALDEEESEDNETEEDKADV